MHRLKLSRFETWPPLIAIIGFILSFANEPVLSLAAIAFLVSLLYRRISQKSDALAALGVLVAGWSLVSLSIYLFGQYVTRLPHPLIAGIPYVLLAYLIHILDNEYTRGRDLVSGVFSGLSVAITGFVIQIAGTTRLISILGLGYDNYGHLSIFRRMLIEGESLVNASNPTEYVTFVGNGPLGVHLNLALLSESIGVRGESLTNSVWIFSFATFLIPVLFFFVAIKIISRNRISKLRLVSGCITMALVFFLGYPSHIWFSGYFGSNFATLLLLLAIGLSLSRTSIAFRIVSITLLLTVMAHVYLLFVLLVFVVLCSVAVTATTREKKEFFSLIKNKLLIFALATAFLLLLNLIALYGILSGFGTGQFLTAGGIATLPIGSTFFIFGLALAVNTDSRIEQMSVQITALIVTGLVSVAGVGIGYAYLNTSEVGKAWSVPYYPTKLAITVLLVCIVLMLDAFVNSDSRSTGNGFRVIAHLALFAGSLGSIVYSGFSSWPFNAGYMGSGPGVAKSLIQRTNEPIEGGLIYDWVKKSNQVQLPVLVLSSVRESELNTRWVNSLALRWNDLTWGASITARNFIESGDFEEGQKILSQDFLLITDNQSIIDQINQYSTGVLSCLYDENHRIPCVIQRDNKK